MWGYTAAIALLVIAITAPVLGAIADYTGGKKKYAAAFVALGVVSTALFVFIGADNWLIASIFYICGNMGFAGSLTFYESFLPHIARKDDIDQVATAGFALGYLGGGILLVINVLWYTNPHWFGMPSQDFALRASFFSVAVWWLLFSIPFFRFVPEPPADRGARIKANPVRVGFSRLGRTFHEIRRYRQLLIFLVAFWIYNDGIGTIIKMASAYGNEIGIGMTDLIFAFVITQFIGIPCSFAFGWLAKRIGAKRSILLALSVYFCIAIGGYFMRTATHFYILALAVGLVQGGAQALSRSLYGVMVPKARSAEFFGFFSTSSKFAGIAGPLIFGVFSQVAGGSRVSISSLIIFFLIGGFLLTRVDVQEGIRVAQVENAAV